MSTPNLIVHHLQEGQGERIPWLLEELSIPYTLKLYKRSPLLSPPELQAKHPIGASPVLEDHTDPSNPIKLAESAAIAEYIIQKYGNGRLALGPTHPNYADYLYWFHFAGGTLQANLFRRATARGMVGEADVRYKGSDARLRTALKFIDERLVKTGAWLAGDEFTAADIMTVWCFTTMRKFEPVDLDGYPGIMAFLGRVGQREAYRTAMAKGDSHLDVDEGLSAKGPKPNELFAKAIALKL